MYKVYIQIDDQGRIIAVNSEAFIKDLDNWIFIDKGSGDKFYHAQGNYFSKPLMNENGFYRYKYQNGIIKERTIKDFTQDMKNVPKSDELTTEERFEQIESAIIELAELVTE